MDTDDLYNEDSKEFSYDFDFYALRKLRTQQKRKITVLSIIIVVLLVLLVTFVLLYTKLNSSSSDNNEKTNSGKITSGRIDCESNLDCGNNSYCWYKKGSTFCACAEGYIKNGTHCEESKENNTKLTCKSDEDCSMNAFCRYKNGTSFCACATGFILDDEKKHCRESKENNTKLTCKSDEDCFMNAFCRYKNGTSFCACATGFILDDQKRHCRDIAFAINFKQRTIRNIPTLYNVIFPETDSVSVCFWYKLRQSPGWVFKRVVSYTIKGKKDFMVWFLEGIMSVISFNNTVRMRRSFVVNRWTQSCWSGRNGGKWTLYVNGKVFSQGTKPRTRKHLTSVGTLYLGQDHDNPKVYNRGRMFEGKITELFIYSGELSKQDVLNSYNHKPRLNDVIVGWWQFKNKTSGKQIVKEHSPFFKEYFTSDQCKSIHCVANAECQTDRSGDEKCNCKEGFVGNGNDTCKDIAFAINFKQRTIRNIPTLHNVTFPETDSASVCFWYKLRRLPGWGYKGVVSYTIKGREDFMVWFHTGEMTVIYFNNTVSTRRRFLVNRWKHFCWSGSNGGKWTLYIDGKVFNQGTKSRTRKHLTSVGTLYLGQDHDNHKVDDPDQVFEGKITELFIYNGELSKQDVTDSYNHKPRLNDVIVGWWQFKNKTSGNQIVEEKSPFLR